MNIDIKCEMIPEEIRADFEAKNQMIVEQNKNSHGKRIMNWIVMILFTSGIILFSVFYLLLPTIQLERAIIAATLIMFSVTTDFLFLLALQDMFFQKEKYNEVGINIRIEEIEFFNQLKTWRIQDIQFYKYKKEVDLEITYEDDEQKISKKMIRGFRKIEDISSEKYILDLDSRTITVPYEKEED